MDNNITAYKYEQGEAKMNYGVVSVRNGYYIINANEKFYEMIGANVCYSVLELIHPDDLENFKAALELMDEEPQHVIARFRCGSNKYHWFYFKLYYNGKIIENFRSFDMEMTEIMTITDKFHEYKWNIDKYRKFISLYKAMFFEYEIHTSVFKIYRYSDGKATLLCNRLLSDVNAEMQANPEFTASQKAEFQIFYEALQNGRDHFKTAVDAEIFLNDQKGIRYEFLFSTLYRKEQKEMAVGLVSVISGQKPKEAYYRTDNAYDPGTGILNKRAINEYAIDVIQQKTPGTYLVIMDVDDFKKINDNYGHMYGDEVLSRVAEIISSVIKGRGMAGRFGGDEFMLVLEGLKGEQELRRIISTINKHIAWNFNFDSELKVTTSIGISKYPEDGVTYDELFLKSDKCLYIAKAKGKNRYIIYNEEKHGGIQKEDAADREVGLKATISDDKKTLVVSEMILKLNSQGTGAIAEVMQDMQSYFDIDGVALYKGERLRRVLSKGKYVNPIAGLEFSKEAKYQEFVDEYGVYMETKMQKLENKSPVAYMLYTAQETGKFYQFFVKREGTVVAVVSFDYFNRSPKCGDVDSGLIRMVGRLMAQVLADGEIEE